MKGYGRTQKDNEQLGKQVPDTVGDCWVREGTGLGNRVKERDELKVTESGVVIFFGYRNPFRGSLAATV